MNYYKRHLGDYAKDTGHLTALEHGVYTLLLDWYYANERPIPKALTVRIARGNPEETQTVLTEFFKDTPEGWIHSYADKVIEEYNVKAERNRLSGNLGGRPKKTQTVSKPNPEITLATSHKPVTIKEQEIKATVRATPAPADGFDEFWDWYPVKKGKEAARKAWAKLKAQPDQVAAIIWKLKQQKTQDFDWQRGYVPHPATYLNGKRWNDEIKRGMPVVAPAPSKTMQTMQLLQDMKNGLDRTGNSNGVSDAGFFEPGPATGFGRIANDG